MKFKDYIEDACLRYDKVARRLGISNSLFYMLINEKADPRLSLIEKIEEFSKGKVKYKDWKKNYPEKQQNNKSANVIHDDV